jgi:hypothetical protein
LCRSIGQFNKGVENAHRDKYGDEEDKPTGGANRQTLSSVNKHGVLVGVEPQADKWYEVYGPLYEKKDVPVQPGAAVYELPGDLVKMHELYMNKCTSSRSRPTSSQQSPDSVLQQSTGVTEGTGSVQVRLRPQRANNSRFATKFVHVC